MHAEQEPAEEQEQERNQERRRGDDSNGAGVPRVAAATDMAFLLPAVNYFMPVHGPACPAWRTGDRLYKARRVNVGFPSWMIESLDREARRPGVTRQSIIKLWIAERLPDPPGGPT
jgi:hypothetical protein